MKLKFKFISFLLFMVHCSVFAEVTLIARVDKAKAKADEPIKLSVTLKYPKDFSPPLDVPSFAHSVQGMRVVDFGALPSSEEDNKIIKTSFAIFKADLSGSYVIPSIMLKYQTKEGEKSIKTGEIFLEIGEVAESSKIKDILDIKDIETRTVWQRFGLIIIVTSLLFLILVVFALVLYFKKKKVKVVKVLTPYEEVQEELRKLQAILASPDFVEDALELKKLTFRLSEVMRVFVEREWKLNATDMTLEEIKKEFDQIRAFQNKRDEVRTLIQILTDLEMVKFANKKMSATELISKIESSKFWVEKTVPQPVAVPLENKMESKEKEEALI